MHTVYGEELLLTNFAGNMLILFSVFRAYMPLRLLAWVGIGAVSFSKC